MKCHLCNRKTKKRSKRERVCYNSQFDSFKSGIKHRYLLRRGRWILCPIGGF